jgi:hypothetical protein
MIYSTSYFVVFNAPSIRVERGDVGFEIIRMDGQTDMDLQVGIIDLGMI